MMNTVLKTIPNLTPLRGIAALMVAIFHFNEIAARFVNPQKTMLIAKCYLMVDLFFIMSGFVMLHVYGQRFLHKISWSSFKIFIIARFARLYPLHLFTLLVAVALFYFGNNPPNPIENPAAIPTHLLLLQSFGIHKVFTWNVPSWSISAEWWAYIVFPLLVLGMGKNKKVAIVLMLALSAILYICIEYFLPRVNPFVATIPVPHNLDSTYDYGFLRGLAGFMAGMLVYTAYQNIKIKLFFSKDLVGLLSILISCIALHVGINDVFYVPIFMLVVLAISSNTNIIHKLISVKPLQYFGEISYSIYLIHGTLIFFVAMPIITKLGYLYKGPSIVSMPFGVGLGVCCIFLLAVIAVSTITYYGIEKPCRKFINSFAAKNKKNSLL